MEYWSTESRPITPVLQRATKHRSSIGSRVGWSASYESVKLFLTIILGVSITATTVWGVGALYFSPLLPAQWRAFAAAS